MEVVEDVGLVTCEKMVCRHEAILPHWAKAQRLLPMALLTLEMKSWAEYRQNEEEKK